MRARLADLSSPQSEPTKAVNLCANLFSIPVPSTRLECGLHRVPKPCTPPEHCNVVLKSLMHMRIIIGGPFVPNTASYASKHPTIRLVWRSLLPWLESLVRLDE